MLKSLFQRISLLSVVSLLATSLWVSVGQAAPGANGHTIYLPLVMGGAGASEPQPGDCMTSEEALLADMVNDYRNANGLPDVPVSKSLVTVAQWHVLDLETNHPDTGVDPRGYACNMHSWSNWKPTLWTAVCYTGDHYYASGMWLKPYEITGGVYTYYGYENAYWSSGGATASGALTTWKGSPGHNAVILELGGWSGSNWPAMGTGIYQNYAVLWFGDGTDPQGSVGTCPP